MTISRALVLSAFVAMAYPHPPAALAQSVYRARAIQPGDVVAAPVGPKNSERVVRDQGECARHEEATPTWSDAGQYLGLVCRTTYSGG